MLGRISETSTSRSYTLEAIASFARSTHPIPVGSSKQSVDFSERQIQLIAKALADPHRYQILKRLGSTDCGTPCSDMRQCFKITAATLSHHMKELETAGLIRSEKGGKFVRYFPQTRVLRAYLDRLKSDLVGRTKIPA
jgi:ArsR family transcriptional regulator, arsenate/arsenite/antimonite-responsive transcriptional repressor